MKQTIRQHVRTSGVAYGFFAVLYVLTAFVFYAAFTTSYNPSPAFDNARWIILILFIPILCKYIVQLAIAPWYPWVTSLQYRKAKSYTPTVSVIIPAWNEEVGILNTVRSVVATQYPHLEIFVINDGSTDQTDAVMQEYLAGYSKTVETDDSAPVIRYEVIKNGGKAKALNYALTKVTGEIVVTVDADSVMDENALYEIVIPFTDPAVAAVAGNVVIGNRSHTIGLIQQLEYLYGFYFKRADSLLSAVYIVGGAAAAYRRSVLNLVHGLSETIITEDIELSTRLQRLGYKVKYAADAIVYTEGPSTVVDLCKQRLRWKYGRLQTFAKHKSLFFSTESQHNKYLSWFILPIALFAEMLLLFEVVLLGIFFVYTIYTNDYMPLAIVITIIATVVSIQVLTDTKRTYHANLLALAPIAWLIFYCIDAVEYQALLRSLSRFATKQELRWQRWQRVGVFGS